MGYFLFLTTKLPLPPPLPHPSIPHSWSLRSGQRWHLFCPWWHFSLPLTPYPRSVWKIWKACAAAWSYMTKAQSPLFMPILKVNSKNGAILVCCLYTPPIFGHLNDINSCKRRCKCASFAFDPCERYPSPFKGSQVVLSFGLFFWSSNNTVFHTRGWEKDY